YTRTVSAPSHPGRRPAPDRPADTASRHRIFRVPSWVVPPVAPRGRFSVYPYYTTPPRRPPEGEGRLLYQTPAFRGIIMPSPFCAATGKKASNENRPIHPTVPRLAERPRAQPRHHRKIYPRPGPLFPRD